MVFCREFSRIYNNRILFCSLRFFMPIFTENQGESLAVHGGDESDSADTTHVWYAERMF